MCVIGVLVAGVWLVANAGSAQTVSRTSAMPSGAPTTAHRPDHDPGTRPGQTTAPAGARVDRQEHRPVDQSRDRPSPRPGSVSGDLFLAGPETYAPHYDRPAASLVFRGHRLGGGSAYLSDRGHWSALPAASSRGPSTPDANVFRRPQTQPSETVRSAEPSVAPEALAAPAVAKTIYIIPGCYAGDVAPQLSRLPPGCDVSNLRRVEPPTRTRERLP